MYCDSESESEKEAILKKICPEITEEGLEIMRRKMPVPDEPKKAENETGGLLTQEEILDILSGEVSPEEMISRWEKENGNWKDADRMGEKKELSPQRFRELKKKLRSASSVAEIQELGSQLGLDFTKELAKEYLETINPEAAKKEKLAEFKRKLLSDEEIDKDLLTYVLGEGWNNQSQNKEK